MNLVSRALSAITAGLLLGAAWLPAQAAVENRTVVPARGAARLRQFSVPLHDGRLHAGELVTALFAEFELDAGPLRRFDASLDLRGVRGSLLLAGSRKLLLGTVRFRRDLAQGRLVVTIDRERARQVRRQLRARLAKFAGRLLGEQVEGRRYELQLPDALDGERPLCVLVHGVESSAAMWADLRAFLESPPRRCQVATFGYPNDEAVERVAAELAGRLRALSPQPIVLVGHSLGGLVARAVVEDPALDPGNVRTLVQTGTPNQGSNLAAFRFGLEAADVLRDAADTGAFARALVAAMVDHWRDGLGEAGGDLLPDSVCLLQLAARPRNPRVDYQVVLGTRAPLTQEQLAAVQAVVREQLAGSALGRIVRPRVQRWLEELDELVDGRGDGAVSVERGKLPGFEPVLVPLDHLGLVGLRGLLGRVDRPDQHPVFVRIAAAVQAAAAR